MPLRRNPTFLVAVMALTSAFGCGAGQEGKASDASPPDGATADAWVPDGEAADRAAADGAAPDAAASDVTASEASDAGPDDGGQVVCAGDRWGGSVAMLEALAGCTVIGGNLSITGNDLLTVDLPRLTRIEGFLTVWGNPVLTRASFRVLATIGGYLDVSSNAALGTLELPALASVNQRSLLVANDVLIRDNALPSCQTDPIREQLAAQGVTAKVTIVADGVPCPKASGE